MNNEQAFKMLGPIGLFLPVIQLLIGMALVLSTPITLLLRPYRKWGERALGYASIYIILGLGAAFAVLMFTRGAIRTGFNVADYNTEAYLLTGFTLAFCFVAGIQGIQIMRRHRRGDFLSVHSYERGETPGFWAVLPVSESTINRFFEPTLVFLVALGIQAVSPFFSAFLFAQALLLLVAENGAYLIRHQRMLDHFDAIIEARWLESMMAAIERGEKLDPRDAPEPLQVLAEQRNSAAVKKICERLLAHEISLENLEDPRLRRLAQVDGSYDGQQSPPEGVTPTGGVDHLPED